MRRTTAAVLAAALSAVVLTACGGGSDPYCQAVEDAQSDIGAISETEDITVGDFSTAADRFGDIAEEAPEDVQDEWSKTADTLARTAQAFEDSGASPDTTIVDAASDPGFAETAQSLQGDLTALGTDMTTISQDVQERCDIDLTQAGS